MFARDVIVRERKGLFRLCLLSLKGVKTFERFNVGVQTYFGGH
ncbi:MAG: hypothetical protein ACTS45_00420 [Candidatus Hodgkinia cicadicola]